MNKGSLTIIVIALALVGIFAYLFSTDKVGDIFAGEDVVNETPVTQPPATDNVVEITSTGFKPNLLVIKKGESVKWINKDTTEHWVASNNHPTHRVYPGSDIEKCGTQEENSIFDSCAGLKPGEEYTFTFDRPGSWKYHDHLYPGKIATIAVQ